MKKRKIKAVKLNPVKVKRDRSGISFPEVEPLAEGAVTDDDQLRPFASGGIVYGTIEAGEITAERIALNAISSRSILGRVRPADVTFPTLFDRIAAQRVGRIVRDETSPSITVSVDRDIFDIEAEALQRQAPTIREELQEQLVRQVQRSIEAQIYGRAPISDVRLNNEPISNFAGADRTEELINTFVGTLPNRIDPEEVERLREYLNQPVSIDTGSRPSYSVTAFQSSDGRVTVDVENATITIRDDIIRPPAGPHEYVVWCDEHMDLSCPNLDAEHDESLMHYTEGGKIPSEYWPSPLSYATLSQNEMTERMTITCIDGTVSVLCRNYLESFVSNTIGRFFHLGSFTVLPVEETTVDSINSILVSIFNVQAEWRSDLYILPLYAEEVDD